MVHNHSWRVLPDTRVSRQCYPHGHPRTDRDEEVVLSGTQREISSAKGHAVHDLVHAAWSMSHHFKLAAVRVRCDKNRLSTIDKPRVYNATQHDKPSGSVDGREV